MIFRPSYELNKLYWKQQVGIKQDNNWLRQRVNGEAPSGTEHKNKLHTQIIKRVFELYYLLRIILRSVEIFTFTQIFQGNTDSDTVVYHDLYPIIKARYIRVLPTDWYRHISMRMELYTCKGKLRLRFSFGCGNGVLAQESTVCLGKPWFSECFVLQVKVSKFYFSNQVENTR